ncbi:uncharacterized protein [Ptychodera flava]|uniref:uncharacterized protein n=1 Tax=Ptychodera flava TaxID=63121 RepID=UPI003969D84F
MPYLTGRKFSGFSVSQTLQNDSGTMSAAFFRSCFALAVAAVLLHSVEAAAIGKDDVSGKDMSRLLHDDDTLANIGVDNQTRKLIRLVQNDGPNYFRPLQGAGERKVMLRSLEYRTYLRIGPDGKVSGTTDREDQHVYFEISSVPGSLLVTLKAVKSGCYLQMDKKKRVKGCCKNSCLENKYCQFAEDYYNYQKDEDVGMTFSRLYDKRIKGKDRQKSEKSKRKTRGKDKKRRKRKQEKWVLKMTESGKVRATSKKKEIKRREVAFLKRPVD